MRPSLNCDKPWQQKMERSTFTRPKHNERPRRNAVSCRYSGGRPG